MFNKLLSKVKPSAKQGGDEEDTEEHSGKSSKKSHDSANKDSGAGAPKNNRISMIIRVVVVLGLAYLAVDQFVLSKKGEDTASETVAVPAKRPRRRKKPAPEAAPKDQVAGASATASANAPAPTPGTDVKAEVKPDAKPEEPKNPQAPAEAINIAPKTDMQDVPKVEKEVEVKADVTADQKFEPKPEDPQHTDGKFINPAPGQVAMPDSQPVEEPVAPVVKKPAEEKVEVEEVKTETKSNVAKGEKKTPDSVGADKAIDALIDKMDGSEKGIEKKKSKGKLEEKIVEESVYVAPPTYEQTGRGLAYNCKEGYWACIDKESYITCSKNMKYNKAHGKAVECAVYNVYNNEADCTTVQKYNVSASVPTTFCH